MLAEFLIELSLHEEQDKIAQIVTGSSSTIKHSMYDEYINASKGKVPNEGKANRVMVKVLSQSGDQPVMTTGSREVVHKVIIAQSIIRRDSQADVQYVDLQSILPLSLLV